VSDNPTIDQVAAEDVESGKIEENLKSRTTWLRLLFMAIYGLVISLVAMVGTVIVVIGFFWVLFTGEVNRELRQIGQAIASYMYDIIRYLTFNTNDKPFPFGGTWPSGETKEDS
jgi:small-conductance mechanosensitive channel